jgi:hypothetical protein
MTAEIESNTYNMDKLDEETLYKNNLKNNKEKVNFWKFLMYATKAENYINEFNNLLYWVSILECGLFLIAIILFISSPSNFNIFWTFITHVVRAALGFILLKRLPKSHTVIEEMKEFENNTVEDIENQVILLYRNLLTNNESTIKPVLIWYFVFTIINIIIDNIIFFYVLNKWSSSTYGLQSMVGLYLIVAFFGN